MSFEKIDFTDLRASDLRRVARLLTDDRAFHDLGAALNHYLDAVNVSQERDLEQVFLVGAQIRTAVEMRPDQSVKPNIHIRMGNYPAIVAFTHGYGGRAFLDALSVISKGAPEVPGPEALHADDAAPMEESPFSDLAYMGEMLFEPMRRAS